MYPTVLPNISKISHRLKEDISYAWIAVVTDEDQNSIIKVRVSFAGTSTLLRIDFIVRLKLVPDTCNSMVMNNDKRNNKLEQYR